ncbi:MAG: protein translocase subunit SecF [Calditrichia bacterium]|nr:protein translocase subunit SecF [Calditrichota bacterium]MCB0268261.1 protein translocase subunit SecF [Calditrichota bacterium]MCB0286194.1 protein translocase subunit SecF [Calditrichota bacterium]MCB9067397.1 protein translocase subunit SecF [Calditrichia bacterium]
MRLFSNTNYSFMNFRKIAFIISGVLVLSSLISEILHGGPRFGIDFRGGTFIELRFLDKNDPAAPVTVPIEDVRNVFVQLGLGNSEIKNYGTPQDVSIQLDNSDDATMLNIKSQLEKAFPQYDIQERRRETVGPKIGGELVLSAVYAILFSMLLILIYIMFRFEFRFGVGAIVALFHDIIITLGVFSLFNIEVTVPIIAALLTIIGYSLNDTIVVYDRIRENMKTFKRKTGDFANLVNRSINETLSRTIVTSGTTLMVVIVLYIFGGEVIKDFALALICGIGVGTYSSIFIASPVLVEWEERAKASEAVSVKKK